jgi:bifunctional non-homologous end joining protein LigD
VVPQYALMIPTLVPKPFHRDGWVYEEKVDGYRMLGYKNGASVRLVSRNDIDHAHRYPAIATAIARLPTPTLVLDGELAVFDAQLRSRFEWLRHRQSEEVATPPVLIAFDLLYVKGRDLTKQPLQDRRPRLEDLVADADRIHAVRRLAPNGLDAWAQVVERGYEGLVAKDNISKYVGGRTLALLKVKQPNWTEDEHRWRRRR